MHIKHIHNAIEKIAEDLSCDADKGVENMDAEMAEKQAEMLEKLCTAEYYARIAKAMESQEKEDEEESKYMMKRLKEEYGEDEGERMYRMGYNNRRYANGRYAPKGRGMRMGYMPAAINMPYMDEDYYMSEYLKHPDYMDNARMRMGYDGGSRGGNMSTDGNRGGSYSDGGNRIGNNGNYGYSDGRGESSRYGRSYDNYRANRRHYTETKNEESKHRMKENIEEIFDDMADMTTEIVRDLTPEEKQKYKKKLETIMQKMA